MKLSELAATAGIGGVEEDRDIVGLSADSRTVRPGFLFAALAGTRAHGSQFVDEARSRGAVALLVDERDEIASDLPVLRSADPRRALALMAAAFSGGQPETVIAVTGTSGKTSIVSFTRQLWAAAGYAAASVGTTGVVSPKRDVYGTLTTPDSIELAELMASLREEGVTHAAMEASSHGLSQRRLDGVKLAAAGFSNLGRDHMDYHATPEDYFSAKMRLFTNLLPKGRPAVVFTDDAWSERAIAVAKGAGADVLTVGRKGSLIRLKRLEHERSRQVAELEADGEIHRVVLPLAGEFQMSNALVAAGFAIATGVAPRTAIAAMEHLRGASGRLELAATTATGAPVFVDYAHKPEALENVLSSVRPFTTGKVIVVFGCGGDRDRKKRPIMGEIASRLADVVIVTDDNPRSEVPAAIRAEILAEAPHAQEIADRAEAIRAAVAMARAGDTVVIAGKGHETGQTVGTETRPFSDHEEVRRAAGEAASTGEAGR